MFERWVLLNLGFERNFESTRKHVCLKLTDCNCVCIRNCSLQT